MMSRGSVRREMLDLPPASINTAEFANLAMTAASFLDLTFTSATLGTKFTTGAYPGRSRGACMRNRITMLNGAAAIVAGRTVTIGADIYEFNAATPPAAGTAGSIWVYQGANSAASRVNFLLAVNGTVSANLVTRTAQDPTAGTNTELVAAVAGTTVGDIDVYSAAAIGGAAAPSSTATALAETIHLDTATDVWDDASPTAFYGGIAATAGSTGHAVVAVTAAMVTKGSLQIQFPFTPLTVTVVDRSRPHSDATTIVGSTVNVTLGGGADPIAALDVLDIIAFGA